MPALTPKKQIPLVWLEENAATLTELLAPWFSAHAAGRISASTLSAIYVVIFTRLWRSSLWTAGSFVASPAAPCGVLLQELGLDFFQYGEKDVFEFLSVMRLRGVSLRSQRALLQWQAGQYDIELTHHVPAAREILQKQAHGLRVVTVLKTPQELSSYTLERDPLEFALHDLEHADEFFHDPDLKAQQIALYRCLQKAQSQNALELFLKHDPHFVSDWEYLIGDMNTHPEHMKSAFRAILRASLKRQLKLNTSEKLPNNEEFLVHQTYTRIFG
jgi:hypothetical protein